jgi:thiol-disulfide isomerase/thioredoxin
MKTRVLIAWMLAAVGTLANERSASFNIESEGKRIENAEVLFFEEDNVLGPFAAVTNGSIKVGSDSGQSHVEYLIRAPGYAIKSGILPDDLSKPIYVNVERGITVELKLEGHGPMPQDLVPVVFPGKILQDAAFSMDARTSHALLRVIDVQPDELHPGTFHFHAARDDSFRVLVHHPGYLRGFVSDLLKTAERVVVKLPEPCGLDVSFRPEHLRKTEKALVVVFKTMHEANAQIRMVYEQNKDSISGSWNDLSPGDYKVEAAEINPANLTKRTEDIETVQLSQGSRKSFTLIPAAQQAHFRGDSTVKVLVRDFENKPLKGADYEFTFFDTNTISTISVACGKTSDSGEIIFNNVKTGANAPKFHAKINGTSQLVQFKNEGRTQDVELIVPPCPGDFAPPFEGKDILTGISKRYPNGRYVIVDFWAVSCGACQTPMAEINDLWRRKASEWTNKVEVVAISLDDTKEEALKRMAEKHWEGISYLWEPGDFNSSTAKKYRVWGLPNSLIVGPNGQVLWHGDPREIRFEDAIDALLNGKLKPEKMISSQRNWLDYE